LHEGLGLMDQGPLVIPAALIRWPPSSREEEIYSQMDGAVGNVLSVLAMVGCLLTLGWLVGPGEEQGQDERPAQEQSPPQGVRALRPDDER
jgi:hypothetical protein